MGKSMDYPLIAADAAALRYPDIDDQHINEMLLVRQM